MQLELSKTEAGIVRHALEAYLSDLRQEVVKTERHERKVGLRTEEETLKQLIGRLTPGASKARTAC